jgi:hypothetical protein
VALPPNHPHIAISLNTLGDIDRELRDLERAIASYDEIVQMDSAGDGALARQQWMALQGRGIAHLNHGAPEKARADLEALLATPLMQEPDPASHCEVHFGLARALRATDGSDARARELARTAQKECGEAGDRGAPLLDDKRAVRAKLTVVLADAGPLL